MRRPTIFLIAVITLVTNLTTGAQADIKRVLVFDGGFKPVHAVAAQGDRVKWVVDTSDQLTHDLTTFLFDSGPLAPGGSYFHKLIGAGVYRISDTANDSVGFVKVPLTVQPTVGSRATDFTLTLGSEPSNRLVYRIQIKRPSDNGWRRFVSNVPGPTYTFRSDVGIGTYQFRVITALASDRRFSHSLPSPGVSIEVDA